jgi:large subunit ribosomal protein L22
MASTVAQPKKKVTETKTKSAVAPIVALRGRFVRTSARKLRLVANQMRGMILQDAIDQLPFMNKGAARLFIKILQSAAANARHNDGYEPTDVTIASIMVNEGPKLKRFMPRAHGRATTILKRMCHVTITLQPVAGATKAKVATRRAVTTETVMDASVSTAESTKKQAASKTGKPVKAASGTTRKVFNRKTA